MTSYTLQEAAAVSGVSLATIQKAITARKIPAGAIGPAKRRKLDETALLAFALTDAMPEELRLSPGAAYEMLLRSEPGQGGQLAIGDLIRIDAGRALAKAKDRLGLYDRALEIMISDPGVMGGAPVIRGTRITAQSVLGRLEGGDSIETVLEDYPYLDRETVEAAALYAKANPPRGRPSGRLWRRAS